MSTIELHRPSSTVGPGEWALIAQQADMLSRADIIPRAYQRKPANVIVAAITGRQYGWDVLTAMRNGHVIEGAWQMKPEAMLGLVRRAGHSVKGEFGNDRATVTGTRNDNGDAMTVVFTFDDAVAAGLCAIKNGKPYARSSQGKALPWEQYPVVMCYWRAVGLLCRTLFSDITGGVYSAEEMGAQITEDGDVIDVGEVTYAPVEPQPLSQEALDKFDEACNDVLLTPEEVLAAAFPDGVPETLTDEHLPAMRDAYRSLVEAQALSTTPEQAQADEGAATTDEQNVDESSAGARPASRSQVGKIKGEYERLGFDRDQQLAYTATIIGRTVDSHNALTVDEASTLIEHLVTL